MDLKKVGVSILCGLLFLTACDSDEPEIEEEIETGDETEEELETEIDQDADEDNDEESEADEVEADPVIIEETLWNLSTTNIDAEFEYDLTTEVGPIIHNNEWAILPITFDSDSDQSINVRDIISSSVYGEGSEAGYEIRLIDSGAFTISHIAVSLDDDDLSPIHTARSGDIGEDNDPENYYAVFAAPETDEVHVMMRRIGLAEYVPVVENEDAFNSMLEEIFGVSSDETLFENVQARVEPIESYRTNIENRVSRLDEVEYSTITLSSDVLFEFDSSDLSEEADGSLEAAIEELSEVDGGNLEIVGHTDDEHTEEYNQELSEDRAEAVHERLEDLADLSVFDDVILRGESFREPIADNDSEEGRAQNRRVELHFTPPAEEIEREIVETELSEALGEESAYPEPVRVTWGGSDQFEADIELASFRRVDNLFVGEIVITNQSEDGSRSLFYDLLQHRAGLAMRGLHRAETADHTPFSVTAPTMIAGNQRYYILDYYLTPLEEGSVEEDEEEEIRFIVPLSERYMPQGSQTNGASYKATVIWPAVEGVDEVIIEVGLPDDEVGDEINERLIDQINPWRMTNVPVEESNQE